MADHPSDPRSTDAYDGVESMTAQAKANGINGFVVSWDGDDENGGNDQGHAQQFQLALRAADADGQVVTGYLESGEAARTGTVGMTELRWLHQLLTYSSDPAFLKDSRGIPVVFVFEMAELSPAQWGAIMSTLASKYGESVDLVGDTTDPAYAHLEGGFARYYTTGGMRGLREYDVHTAVQAKAGAVVDHAVDPKLFVGTVSPGFDDRCKRPDQNDPVLSRDDGARYTDTWRAALSAQPDWILVTSWNEWYEDTEIEPGVHTGSQALTQTKNQAAAFSR